MSNTVDIPEYFFYSPSTISISGATSSGKTFWVKKLLSHKQTMFKVAPTKVVFFYGIWQSCYDDMSDVEFVQGLPTDIDAYTDGNNHCIWIIDDLMNEVVNNKSAEELFTRGSHHKNITVIYINQNIFCQGKCSRTIALNTHYNVLFKNPRDVEQISRLDRQIGMKGLLKEAYNDAVSTPYGYVVLDLSPHNHSNLKLWTCILPDEHHVVYIK